jgi:hypothetical protein
MLAAVFFAILGIAGLGYLGFDWYSSRELILTEQPGRDAKPVQADVRSGEIVMNVGVPYATVRGTLDRVVNDFTVTLGGRQNVRCWEAKVFDATLARECLEADWSVEVKRHGEIAISGNGERMRVIFPLFISGETVFSGTVASLLDVSHARFTGEFFAISDATLGLDKALCPVVEIGDIGFDWQELTKAEIFGRHDFRLAGVGFTVGPWKLPLGPLVGRSLKDSLRAALAGANGAIPCDERRSELVKLWQDYAIPATFPDAPAPSLTVVALGRGPDGLFAEAERAQFIASLNASTEPAQPRNIAALRQASTGGEIGRSAFRVPVRAPYSLMSETTSEALHGKVFEAPVDTGKVTVRVRSVEVYPSGDRLAAEISFGVRLPGRVLETLGRVWMTARPVLDPDGRRLRVTDVTLTRRIDGPLWPVVDIVVYGDLRKALEATTIADLGPVADRAVAKLRAVMSDPSRAGRNRFSLGNTRVAFTGPILDEDGLVAEAMFDATID